MLLVLAISSSLWTLHQVDAKTISLPIRPVYNIPQIESHVTSKSIKLINDSEPSMYASQMKGDLIEIRTSVWVGGIEQEVIVDTGSNVLVVPSTSCYSCSQDKPFYRPSKNMEFMSCQSDLCQLPENYCLRTNNHPNGVCALELGYMDGTTLYSYLSKDQFKMSSEMDDITLNFGAIYSQTKGKKLLYGILGMGNSDCKDCWKSAIDAVFDEHNITKTFGLWIDEHYTGVMTIGDLNPFYYSKSLSYTPLYSLGSSHYSIMPTYISIGGSKKNALTLSSREFGVSILDSGTSFTLLASPAYDSLYEHLTENYCHIDGVCDDKLFTQQCMQYSDDEVGLFPTIVIGLAGGEKMVVEPSTYFVTLYIRGLRYRCLGIGKSPLQSTSIFGLSWFRKSYIIFDKENNKFGIGKRRELKRLIPAPPEDPDEHTSLKKDVVQTCSLKVQHQRVANNNTLYNNNNSWSATITNIGEDSISNIRLLFSSDIISTELEGEYPNKIAFPDYPECNLKFPSHFVTQ
ncbi:hypothetical protein SAMD00019534_005880 [Acytostelium subglobosum LB1]|uniref:hypothetical protein n=1 Tax=Acytostelium subglobosum LB1 TaxID=1410327 RepID=UPI00064502BE|nr:hypothetical protein SAMD00019534_005880 [Acytostelium subglobosum LB1]GAM17413.1 hypothetical protein SAMD00019534_005880 [Acytostelium subglobosum LB1]|eukprot:XP_012759475.1 hypothetical protein SAMD00019534_005880 [Acytostelium subglobosum LB1]